MRKMKKLAALILAGAMVLGMSTTAMAETDNTSPYQADITIEGLTNGESTTVNIFAAITLNADENEWVVADWANEYVELKDTDGDEKADAYVIKEGKELLVAAAPVGVKPAATEVVTTGTTAKFENLPVGAYLIVAAGDKTTYTTLIAETYKGDDEGDDEIYMAAEDVTVVAKASNYKLDKVVDDEFVKVGQVLNFDVTTTFPNFKNPSATSTYKITDTPTNLEIDVNTVKVYIADMDNELTSGYTAAVDPTTGVLTVDLSGSIGLVNTNAGKTVKVEYQATVTGTTDDEKAFENTVVATRDGEELGEDSTNGYTGDITITKTDDKATATVLNGAKFNVYQNYDATEGVTKTPLKFKELGTKVEGEGDNAKTIAVYELAADGTVTDIVATNGYVRVIGLEEGTYWFDEIEAPAGYSINEAGVTVTIADPDDTTKEGDVTAHIHENGTLQDTKLIALPSTGGIGTTIFTIGGVVIIVAAASMLFARRRVAR